MGLDMYFYEVESFFQPDRENGIDVIVPEYNGRGTAYKERKINNVSHIVRNVGYLRKANCIHAMIINGCADGVDDKEPVRLKEMDIKRFVERIDGVLGAGENWVKVAKKEIPTLDGVFFGSTKYNELYLEDLKKARSIFSQMLSDSKEKFPVIKCYYEACW